MDHECGVDYTKPTVRLHVTCLDCDEDSYGITNSDFTVTRGFQCGTCGSHNTTYQIVDKH